MTCKGEEASPVSVPQLLESPPPPCDSPGTPRESPRSRAESGFARRVESPASHRSSMEPRPKTKRGAHGKSPVKGERSGEVMTCKGDEASPVSVPQLLESPPPPCDSPGTPRESPRSRAEPKGARRVESPASGRSSMPPSPRAKQAHGKSPVKGERSGNCKGEEDS